MNTTSLVKTFGSALLLLGVVNATMPSAQAAGRVIERNLQEWLDTQGTLYPPSGIFGWGNNPDRNGDGVDDAGPRYFVWFDYAGVLSRAASPGGGALAPTSITGKATEMPQGDGSSIVTIHLNIKDAFCWVELDDGSGQVVLGSRSDAAQGAPAAHADVNFTIEFKQATGAPFIDLIETSFDKDGNWTGAWTGFKLSLRAEGPLTEFFDPSIPAGTLGRLTWGKPGLHDSIANGNADNGAASLYPNDQFHLGPIGQR